MSPRFSIGRLVGTIASALILVSVLFLPYVDGDPLATAIQPSIESIPEFFMGPNYVDFMLLLSSIGFVLIVFGAIIGLLCFGVIDKGAIARSGMKMSLVGLLLISAPVFQYEGTTLARLFTVTNVEYYPTFEFFEFGYWIAWAGIILGLLIARPKAVPLPYAVAPIPTAQPVISREILTSEQARTIKQVEKGRVPTGYEALDKVLLGGIPAGSTVVLTAPACDERDLIMARLVETSLGSGQGCVFVSSSIDRVREVIPKYGKDLQIILCHPQADVIAANYPDVIKLRTVDDLTAINLEYKNALARIGPGKSPLLCVEILGDILLRHHGPVTRKWLMDVLARVKSGNMIALATFNPKMHSAEDSHTVIEAFDGHIEVQEDMITRGAKIAQIKKLAGQKFIEKDLLVEKERI